jgi:hypothetical protein
MLFIVLSPCSVFLAALLAGGSSPGAQHAPYALLLSAVAALRPSRHDARNHKSRRHFATMRGFL